MRKAHLLFFLLLSFIQGFCQQKSIFSVSIGTSIYTKNEREYYTYHLTGFPSIGIGKDFDFKVAEGILMAVSPGINYSRYKEGYESSSSALGGHSERNIKNSSLSTYSKVLLRLRTTKNPDAFISFGIIGGLHLLSKSKGRKVGVMYYAPDGPKHWDDEVDNNGKDFFKTGYFGYILELSPGMEKPTKIRPSFELSYLPGFAKTYEKSGGMIQFSVLLHFNKIGTIN